MSLECTQRTARSSAGCPASTTGSPRPTTGCLQNSPTVRAMAGGGTTVRPPATACDGRSVHCPASPRWSRSGGTELRRGGPRMADPAPTTLLVRGARLPGSAEPVDTACASGTITAIGPGAAASAGGEAEVLDAGGALVTPPYVEPHV